MFKKLSALVLAVVLCLSVFTIMPLAASANLITNGSFELAGPASSGTVAFYSRTQYPGWTVEKNYLEVIKAPITCTYRGAATTFTSGQDGKNFAELNSYENTPATIYQDFPTNPNTMLFVTFYMSCRYNAPTAFSVSMGSPGQESTVLTTYTSDATDFTNKPGQWSRMSFYYNVPAGQTQTRLKFKSLNGDQYSAGNDIDNVSVVEVTSRNAAYASIDNGNAINVTTTSATISQTRYNVTNCVENGIVYGTSMDDTTWAKASVSRKSPFDVTLTGLKPNTTYYYNAYCDVKTYCASSVTRQYRGTVKSFTTGSDVKIISVNGSVVWNDLNNKNFTRPASYMVGLFRNNTLITSVNVDPQGAGTFSFDNLPEKDFNGNVYNYTVGNLDATEGYNTSVNGTTITNSLKKLYLTTIYMNVFTNQEITRDSLLVLYGDPATAFAKVIPSFQLLSQQGTVTFPRMTKDETVHFYYQPY